MPILYDMLMEGCLKTFRFKAGVATEVLKTIIIRSKATEGCTIAQVIGLSRAASIKITMIAFHNLGDHKHCSCSCKGTQYVLIYDKDIDRKS